MSQQPPPYQPPQGQPPQNYPGAYGPPPASAPPPGGYGPPGMAPQPVMAQPAQATGTTVVVMGPSCARCGRGPITEEFTACGIILAICFFPLGILCCMLMREKKCASCGATF